MNILTYIWSEFHRVFTDSEFNVEYIHSQWDCYMSHLYFGWDSSRFPLTFLGQVPITFHGSQPTGEVEVCNHSCYWLPTSSSERIFWFRWFQEDHWNDPGTGQEYGRIFLIWVELFAVFFCDLLESFGCKVSRSAWGDPSSSNSALSGKG